MNGETFEKNPSLKRVMVVTGSRAEFGLLAPVMHAIGAHADLELAVVAAGSHLIPPALTFRDVKEQFLVADSVPMQGSGRPTRLDDAQAAGRGIARFARTYAGHQPDWVVVLGDRIEAFAAASAASIGGIPVAHLHGGDRAEGIADEALRHAITKLAHLHLPASERSAARIRAMGEPAGRIVVIGSPAIDGLDEIGPLNEADLERHTGSRAMPQAVVLMHPAGRDSETEEAVAAAVLEALSDQRVLALYPNHDPGREGIVRALEASGAGVHVVEHLPRKPFIGLLRRLADEGGVLVGNSSAGLIEAAALELPVVNVGPRQAGRERPGQVVDAAHETTQAVRGALLRAHELDLEGLAHPFGDGHAGQRAAEAIAQVDLSDPSLLRKRFADSIAE